MGRVEWKDTLLGEQTVPIVITGGTGCVGTAIITCLLERLPHVSIHVLDLVIPAQNDPRFVPGVAKYHQGDVTDLAAVLDIFSEVGPKAIVHSASLIPSAAKNLGVGNEGLEKVNIQGTENVLEAARAIGSVEAFVYTSSCDVVKPDPWVDLVNVTEEGTAHLVHSKQWRQKYPETKAMAELLVLSDEHPFKTCAIRTHGVIGTNDNNIIPLLVSTPRHISLGAGKNQFDFTGADNVALAHVLALENLLLSHEPSAHGRAFFVTDGRPLPMRDVQEMIWQEFDAGGAGGKPKYVIIPIRLVVAIFWLLSPFLTPSLSLDEIGDGTTIRSFDISQAKQILGYIPKKPLEESIRDAVNSYKQKK